MDMAHWSVSVDRSTAVFTALPPAGRADSPLRWQPRVSHGVGVGVPMSRAGSLVACVDDLLAGLVENGLAPNTPSWWRSGLDHTEQVIYLRGPALLVDHTGADGYLLTNRFGVAIAGLRSFRSQLGGTSVWS